MKPFQFYGIKRFPKLVAGEEVKNQIQMTFSGEGEEVDTTFSMINPAYEGSLQLMRAKSEIKHTTFGFIKAVMPNNVRTKLEFSEYLEPVDFNSYLDWQRNVVIFQAPKKVCKGVMQNLKANPCGVELIEMKVDFKKLFSLCSEFQGAWFRKVSTNVNAAGLTGDQIQDDRLFKHLMQVGELSNVSIPWEIDGNLHRVMITGSGAIVLIQDYKANQGLELQIVQDVFDKLLCKVWEPKKTRNSDDDPGAP